MSADFRAGKFDVIAVRGADMAFTVTATSGGSPVDLSAATIAGELYASDGSVADTMTDVVSGAGSNIITLSFTDTETTALTGDSYPWTLWVTRGGDKRPWLAGRVRVVDSSNGVTATNGDAITLTVDSDINVSIDVLAVGGSGGGGDVASVNGQTGTVVLDADDIDDTSTTNKFATAAQLSAVDGLASTYVASDDVRDLVVLTQAEYDLLTPDPDTLYYISDAAAAYQPIDADLTTIAAANNGSVLAATTASFLTADETKLDGVESGADVTDEANVTDALDGATLTDVGTPASGDLILLQDASDSNNLKVAQFSTFGGGGGGGEPTRLWMDAASFNDTSLGVNALTEVERQKLWSMPTGNAGIVASTFIPSDWTTWHADLYWTNLGAGSGDVVWEGRHLDYADGDTIAALPSPGGTTFTAPAQNVMEVSRIMTSVTAVAGAPISFLVVKLASGETLANASGVYGLLLVKAS